MFKGIQNVIHKSGKYSPKPVTSDIMPLQQGDELINVPKRAKLIKETLPLLCLSPEDTSGYCHALLHRFAEFVQEMPETRHSFYSRPGGFLDHAIERSHVALKLCRAYFLPAGDETTQLSPAQTRWAYALYSASMLHDVGRLIVDLSVKLFNSEQDEGHAWHPFDGSMITQGALYQYNFNDDYPEEFRRYASLLLAKKIMPEEGLRWITADRNVFLVWMALILDDGVNSGTLGATLDRADAQAIANHCRELGQRIDASSEMTLTPTEPNGLTLSEPTVADTLADRRMIAESGAGLAFINWLRSELAEGRILINSAALFGVQGGMLIGDALKQFIQNNAQYKSVDSVRNSLRALGVLSSSEHSITHISDGKKITGYMFTQPHLILQGLSADIAKQYQAGLSQFATNTTLKSATQYFATNGQVLSEAQVKTLSETSIQQLNPFHR